MHRTLAESIELFRRGISDSTRPEDRTLASQYMAALAPLLARAILGGDLLQELPKIERLFGQTWLVDETPFQPAFDKWRTFKQEYETFVLSGMTVNERLHALGTLEEFERASRARDREHATRLLKQARVDEAAVRQIVESL